MVAHFALFCIKLGLDPNAVQNLYASGTVVFAGLFYFQLVSPITNSWNPIHIYLDKVVHETKLPSVYLFNFFHIGF